MHEKVLRDLQARVTALERDSVRFRTGIVTATSPLAVRLGGSDTAYELKSLGGASFDVDDIVAVLAFGNDRIVLGVIA